MFMECVNCKLSKDISLFQRRYKYAGYCDDCILEIKRNYGRSHYYTHKRRTNPIIYRIDFPDGKFYIGSSKQKLKERIRLHFTHTFNDNCNNMIHQHIRKFYTKSSQYLHLLESSYIIEEVSEEDQYKRERELIRDLKPTLNVNKGKYSHSSPPIKKGPKKGEKHPNSKLTEDDVIKIRDLYQNEKVSQSEIARLFKISHMTVNQIVNFKTWREVQ